ncbi:MAG: hypothetical protein JSU70_09520 [Phycisphaerales bacterium]|nr:MAG: hypothetical protein JSU70_09520 [Phycisphaerales bacterium]
MFEKEHELGMLDDFEQYDVEYEEFDEDLEDESERADELDSAEYDFDRYLLEEEKEEY